MRLGRSRTFGLPLWCLCLGAVWIFHAQDESGAADYQAGVPYAYLFDTGSPAADPLPAAALTAKTGWVLLPEDTVAHEFSGDAVLANNKLTVVLRGKGRGAEVYSQTAFGLKLRAVLVPLSAPGGSVGGLSAIRILENSPAAAALQATFGTAESGRCSVVYRLTTGQATLEIRAGEGTGRLSVRGETRYVVVPDFFADDMVFGVEAFQQSRLRLPAENFLLSLLDQGNAMVMLVWQSSKQGAEATLSDQDGRRTISACEIQCQEGKSLWAAFWEGTNLWHERQVAAQDAKADIVLDWKPPFPAKWRASLAAPDGVAQSWYFHDPSEAAETSPPPGRRDHPCCLDGDRAVLRLRAADPALPAQQDRGMIVVYAIDRSRATPLTAYCPVDVLRNTLGIGPCQYILQTEGLASETNPTPDNVMNWVEQQFAKRKEKKAAEEIRELLKQMADHVGRAQLRIELYADLVRDVRALCKDQERNSSVSDAAAKLSRVLAGLEQTLATDSDAAKPVQRAARLADELAGLIGKDNALADCRRLGAEVREIGALQDRTLSKCRMGVRWLKQQAVMIAAGDPHSAELAGKVQARADQLLQDK